MMMIQQNIEHFFLELLSLRRSHEMEDDAIGTSHDDPKGNHKIIPKITDVIHLIIRMTHLEDQLVSRYSAIPTTGHRNISGTNETWRKECTQKAEQESPIRSNGTKTLNHSKRMCVCQQHDLGYLLIPHFMTMYIRHGTSVFEKVPQYKQPGMTVQQFLRDNNSLNGILQSVFNVGIGIQIFHTPIQVQG
jgi:hypothetical protein